MLPLSIEAIPQGLPGQGVAVQQFTKAPHLGNCLTRLKAALGNGMIAGGEQGDGLFDGHRTALFQLQVKLMGDIIRLFDSAPLDHHRLIVQKDAGPCRLCHLKRRLVGLNL